MCGISGVIGRGTGSGWETLGRMHEQIPHRGPDGEGFLAWSGGAPRRYESLHELRGADGDLLFGFRWLAIQDTDARACQPMASSDGRYWVVFNGEIYNFPEIRSQLEADGDRFVTSSDTEVLLASWRRWGVRCLERFEGMWAFLLFDSAERALYGSRDRLGIKPLFWARSRGRILFGSEIRQILAAGNQTPTPDPLHVGEFLEGRRARIGSGTSWAGIRAVPPGSWFRLDLSTASPAQPTFRRFWNLCPVSRSAPDDRKALHSLEETLRRSVLGKSRSVVRHGILLSGGLDSSLVVAMAASAGSGAPLETVSLVDPGHPEIDESGWITDVAERYGVESHRVTLNAAWAQDALDDVTRAQDEPLIASTLLAQYRVLQESKRLGFTVMLDGQGADEVFGGYYHHQFVAWRNRLASLDADAVLNDPTMLIREFGGTVPGLVARHLMRPFAVDLARRAIPSLRKYPFLEPYRRDAELSERRVLGLKESLVRDITRLGLPPLLLYSDRNGMANSVEVRLPYLDHRIVEEAMSLPDRLLVTPSLRKVALRKIATPLLPESVLARTDTMGFVTPEADWLRGPFRSRVFDEVSESPLDGVGVDREGALRWIERFMSGQHQDFRSVWRLMALAVWLRVSARYGGSGSSNRLISHPR